MTSLKRNSGSTRKSRGDVRLRVLGRSEFLLEPIRQRAADDLDFEIDFELVDSIESLQRAVARPDSFDVYHQWHTVDLIWTARSMQPIDLRRIEAAAEIKMIALAPHTEMRARTPVFDRLFVQDNGTLGQTPTDSVAMLPSIHGVDAFGYIEGVREAEHLGEDSWGWLLDRRLHGRAALMSDASQGLIEAALATEATDGVRFQDISNLTVEEIDHVVDKLIRLKKLGHFKGFWNNSAEAARLMRRGAVVQSIWAPALVQLQSEGVGARCAVPVEGSRGWHADLCLSTAVEGDVRDAAYEYLNWWMNGRAGSVLARQGYYMALPSRARRHLSAEEWSYWYEGKPAEVSLTDPNGVVCVNPGDVRDGGSHLERMNHVRVWNTFIDEHTYLVHRWREFLAA